MKTLSQALKTDFVRVTSGDRWLFWSSMEKAWIVSQRSYMAKKTKQLCITKDQKIAVDYLLGNRG